MDFKIASMLILETLHTIIISDYYITLYIWRNVRKTYVFYIPLTLIPY